MFQRLLLFLFACCALHAELKDPYVLAATEGDPTANLCPFVNSLTGDFALQERDLMVAGPVPLAVTRSYISGDGSSFWEFFPHTKLYLLNGKHSHKKYIRAFELSGTAAVYTRTEENPKVYALSFNKHGKGVSNTSQGMISGRTNLRNHRFVRDGDMILMHAADGTKRSYYKERSGFYLLRKEKLPSGHYIFYNYDKYDRLLFVCTMDPSKKKSYARIDFIYEGRPGSSFRIEASDGRVVHYEMDEGQLVSISAPGRQKKQITYAKGFPWLLKKIKQGDRELEVKYARAEELGCGKVEEIYETIGDVLMPAYRFSYDISMKRRPGKKGMLYLNQGMTEVRDAEGNLTRVHFTPSFYITEIERFSGNKLYSRILFTWGEYGQILSKKLVDADGRAIQERRFEYDERGNVLKESLLGELRESGVWEEHAIFFTYDARNRMLSRQEEEGSLTLYKYMPGTDLLVSRWIMEGGEAISAEYRSYNEDKLLAELRIEEAGGVCKITRYSYNTQGLPEKVSEFYREGSREVPLKTTRLSYSREGWVEEKRIFDAEGIERYILHFAYDEGGNLTSESNALGEIAKRWYDTNGNEIVSMPCDGPRQKKCYDLSGRLIELQEIGDEGESRTMTFTYDLFGRLLSESDHLGRKTDYSYDLDGNVIEKTLPEVEGGRPSLRTAYDLLGNLVERVTPEGHTTKFHSTVRGSPLLITFSDGSVERFCYNKTGTLIEAVDQEGNATKYLYDSLQRLLAKESSGIAEERYSYEGFRLSSYTDIEGRATLYRYDAAGRKISEKSCESEVLYQYDSLGQIACREEGCLLRCSDYDLLGRVVEEREEDLAGQLFSKRQYRYDRYGHVAEMITFDGSEPACESARYDDWGRLLEQCDPLGNRTRYFYEGLCERAIDPLGKETITQKDALERIICIEKKNQEGKQLSFEEFKYDLDGHLRYSLVEGKLTTIWHYDAMGRIEALIQAKDSEEERTTSYTYTPRGMRSSLVKPDGIEICFQYDALGRLEELSSSVGDICYRYTYADGYKQPNHVIDVVTGESTERAYTEEGKLAWETLANGLELFSAYDARGRRTELRLPDGSSVCYSYDAKHLREVAKYAPDGQEQYLHRYTKYSMRGRPEEMEMIASLGRLLYESDLAGHRKSMRSSFFTQEIERNPCGNILRLVSCGELCVFGYNELDQLISDNIHTYEPDALSRRLAKDGCKDAPNLLDQLPERFTYDPNGNPLCDLESGTLYSYDSLGRLISLTKPEEVRFSYAYDPFHRRLSSLTEVWTGDSWQETERLRFLYDGENEIGAFDTNEKPIQLRILGIGEGAEIGAAIACEIDGVPYAPLHDLFGNIALLIDAEGRIAADCRYSAFGEELSSNTLSPWRFSSKRTDPSGLVYFGRRYYLPALGRWLTSDPAGLVDGHNTYAYLHHSPLGSRDLYGLFSKPVDLFTGFWGANLVYAFMEDPVYKAHMEGLEGYEGHIISYHPTVRRTNNRNLPRGIVLFSPGIQTTSEVLHSHMKYISDLGGGIPVHALLEPDYFIGMDIAIAYSTRKKEWNASIQRLADFCEAMSLAIGPNGGLLNIGHSRGGLNNCFLIPLLHYETRSKLEAVNIAPAKILLRESGVKSVVNYISNDFVPRWDTEGLKAGLAEGSVEKLFPHPRACSWWDHDFQSPTYEKPLRNTLEDFVYRYYCE